VLKGPVSRVIPAIPGNRVSMIPLETIHNASLAGVQWSFSAETLSVRGFTSISNKATHTEVKVAFEDGSAYLFIECDEPQWFLAKTV
jgi:thiamine pyrophosphokinase